MVELPTVTYSKPTALNNHTELVEIHTKPKESLHLVENGGILSSESMGFNTATRPAATSTIQRAYLVDGKADNVIVQSKPPIPKIVIEDTVDSGMNRSRSPLMYTTAANTLPSSKPVELKRAYLITENTGPGRALSVDGGRGGAERTRLVVQGGLKRTSSDSHIRSRILVPPGSSATLQRVPRREQRLVPVTRTGTRQRVYSTGSSRAQTEPVLVGNSAPTLLRIHPGQVTRRHDPNYYLMKSGTVPPPGKSYQVRYISMVMLTN